MTYAKDTAIISLTNRLCSEVLYVGMVVPSAVGIGEYHQSLYGIGVPYRNCFIMQVKGSAIGVAGSFFVALVLYHKTAESATNIYPTDRHRSHIFASNGSKWNDRTQTPCKSKNVAYKQICRPPYISVSTRRFRTFFENIFSCSITSKTGNIYPIILYL